MLIPRLFFLFSTVVYPMHAMSVGRCPSAFPNANQTNWVEEKIKVFDESISVRRLTGQSLRYRSVLVSDFAPERSVFIGMMPNRHMYVMAAGYRYDGNLFQMETTLRDSRILSPGVVVRLEDDDGTLYQNFKSYFESAVLPASFNCVTGVCMLSREASDLPLRRTLYPHQLMKQLMTGDLGPRIKREILIVGDHDVARLMQISQKESREITIGLGFGLPMAAGLIVYLTSLLF